MVHARLGQPGTGGDGSRDHRGGLARCSALHRALPAELMGAAGSEARRSDAGAPRSGDRAPRGRVPSGRHGSALLGLPAGHRRGDHRRELRPGQDQAAVSRLKEVTSNVNVSRNRGKFPRPRLATRRRGYFPFEGFSWTY